MPGIVFHIVLFTGLFAWLAWLISNGYRRHLKMQLQNRLLDRFSSATDLVAFLETEGGRDFMNQISDKIASPEQGVLNAVRLGIVLIFVGIGVGFGAHAMSNPDHMISESIRLDAAGAHVILFLGIGFLVSAWVSLKLARRLRAKDDSGSGK